MRISPIIPIPRNEPQVPDDGIPQVRTSDVDREHNEKVMALALSNATGISYERLVKHTGLNHEDRGTTPGAFESRDVEETLSILTPFLLQKSWEGPNWAETRMHYAYIPAIFFGILNVKDSVSAEELKDMLHYFYRLPVSYYLGDSKYTVDEIIKSLGIPEDIAPQEPLEPYEAIDNAHRFSEKAALFLQEVLAEVTKFTYSETGSKAAKNGVRALKREDAFKYLKPLLGISLRDRKTFRTVFPVEAAAFPLRGKTAQGGFTNERTIVSRGKKSLQEQMDLLKHVKIVRGNTMARIRIILDDQRKIKKLCEGLHNNLVAGKEEMRYIDHENITSILQRMLFVLENPDISK